MTTFLSRYRTTSNGRSSSKDKKKEKDEPPVELTPLEKMLQNAGPVKQHDTAKFFGLENFGNTCYCNSIVQALFYSEMFRDCLINYPQPLSASTERLEVAIRPPTISATPTPAKKNGMPVNPTGIGIRPEDRPDAPEYKKKHAMLKGPILELIKENTKTHGMEENTFTGLKDIFIALLESQSRTGVLSPQRFLELFKRDNEMFRNSMHQDAHEFYGLVLNDIISNLEAHARAQLGGAVNGDHEVSGPESSPVRNIFEGLLSSETRCLMCETVSKKDETFLDLSIDLEEHSSVTSCLSKFSEEEVLCERNKFQCDRCGGLQEAEKRMKIERLPKILALHLKRFKYTEDFTRLQKLQHRVVYPSHLRLFNTTPTTANPTRVYELYAVVVHIGGNAYHGHYVSVVKTSEYGWLLFDDEMVEPVDENYVNNFFGEPNGLATAYVLFYRETTYDDAMKLDDEDTYTEIRSGSVSPQVDGDSEQAVTPGSTPLLNGTSSATTFDEPTPGLATSHTAPLLVSNGSKASFEPRASYDAAVAPSVSTSVLPTVKEDRRSERKRVKEEKEQKQKDEKERKKQEGNGDEEKGRKASNGNLGGSFLDRASWSGKSMSRRGLAFLSSKKQRGETQDADGHLYPAPPSTAGTTSTTATNGMLSTGVGSQAGGSSVASATGEALTTVPSSTMASEVDAGEAAPNGAVPAAAVTGPLQQRVTGPLGHGFRLGWVRRGARRPFPSVD